MLTLIKVNPYALNELATMVPEHLVGQIVWELMESMNTVLVTTGQTECGDFHDVVESVVTSLLMSSNQAHLRDLNPVTEAEKEDFTILSDILTDVFGGLLASALDYDENVDAALNIDLKSGEYYKWYINPEQGHIHVSIH